MNDNERLATVASVVGMLRSVGSWTGRMHIQKLIYMAQELDVISPAYDFVLYQRGPYSFGLDADIRELRSIGAVDIRPTPPYGPTYETTVLGAKMAHVSPLGGRANRGLQELAVKLGVKKANDLELLATTIYVLQEGKGARDEIIDRVRVLKPHFNLLEVEKAMGEVEELKSSFSQI